MGFTVVTILLFLEKYDEEGNDDKGRGQRDYKFSRIILEDFIITSENSRARAHETHDPIDTIENIKSRYNAPTSIRECIFCFPRLSFLFNRFFLPHLSHPSGCIISIFILINFGARWQAKIHGGGYDKKKRIRSIKERSYFMRR